MKFAVLAALVGAASADCTSNFKSCMMYTDAKCATAS